MWTRLFAGGACVLASVITACASNQNPPKQAEYFRSPTRDYVDPPRSASDGEVLGAHQHPPEDWILVAPTQEHPAVGWTNQDGRFRFERELARAGHGVTTEPVVCAPPVVDHSRSASEREENAALYRAWLEARQPSYVASVSNASVDLPAQPNLLDCNR